MISNRVLGLGSLVATVEMSGCTGFGLTKLREYLTLLEIWELELSSHKFSCQSPGTNLILDYVT